jgi:hypothetical protein
MDRISVKSSQIAGIGWEPNSAEEPQGKGVLEVQFTSTAVYRYTDVPYLEYRKFLAAESKGVHFNTWIRANYEYVCVFKPEKKQKEEGHGETIPNPSLTKDLKKSIKAVKDKKRA